MTYPIPCAHCGVNYMRHNLDPNLPRLCNSCQNKELSRYFKGVKMTDEIAILIKMDKKTHANIEEFCINKGISFSEYFLRLHESSLPMAEYIHNTEEPEEEKQEIPMKKKGVEKKLKEL